MMYKNIRTFLTFCLTLSMALVLSATAAHKSTFDELIGDLSGNNEVKRSLARQLIPRQGAAAIPYVLPLLFQENSAVSWAANNVILDIANDVSVAGREAERATVTTTLLEALAATDDQTQQFTLLRILPVVVPEGADIQAIATLLSQENTRERARRALQEINTTEARTALGAALSTADPEFACALMDALDKTNDTKSIPLIREKLAKGTPAEQTAAALALARTANPALVAPCLALGKSIDINHRFDVEDATLQLADALAKAGGTWEAGMALYRAMLTQSENSAIQGAALAGLGRYGDETALDTIMTAWSDDASGLLEGPAIAAIESLQDPAVAELLIAAYARQPVPVKERLLGIMGRTRDPRYLSVFEGAADIAPVFRIDALEQSRLPQAIPLLEALAGGDDAATTTAAVRAITTMAAVLRDQGDSAGAGRAYLASYRIATDDEARAQALEGIKAFPIAEAYDELRRELGDDGLLKL
ncbi:MAG: hypothetical protein L3K26_02840, partial [Candidatus Hydrogenedentes bacterium]|nr:hypothetical protein [Candidatus Hydrogenedentota bacterium]